MLVRAITLPGYRAFALAPYSIQASEVYKQALLAIQGTEYEKFLIGSGTKPFPHLDIGNDVVGKNTIECYPIMDDPGKILTLTGDEGLVDQAEKLDGEGSSIDDVVRSLGSRLRGMYNGRPRVGQITLVANSADNPQLWDWYDEGQEPNQDYVWSYAPGTFENEYLTIADLIRFERQVGKDDYARRMYMLGERPIGSGEHFSQESLKKCRSKTLDDMMTDAIDTQAEGWQRLEAPRVGVHTWEAPPEDGHKYMISADTGWSNPPDRNTAVIAVWDVTNFPKVPLTLRAFCWVFGNNSPNPWIAKYVEYVQRYDCIGFNGYDATGPGAGYERMEAISACLPMPVNLGNTNKMVYLNLCKKMFADGMFAIPNIPHLFSQCAKYRLPDDKLRQDIVMMLVVAAALTQIYGLLSLLLQDYTEESDYDPDDRYWRGESERDEDRFSVSEER